MYAEGRQKVPHMISETFANLLRQVTCVVAKSVRFAHKGPMRDISEPWLTWCTVKSKDGPRYIPGTVGSCVALGIEFLLIVSWRYYYVWQNWKRDKAAAASGISKEEQERIGQELGEQNCTDLENPHFRYTM